MGEAIARFREMALHRRRERDRSLYGFYWLSEKGFRDHFASVMRAYEDGDITSESYCRSLVRGHEYVECLRKQGVVPNSVAIEKPRSRESISRLADAAVKEAIAWGSMFSLVEPRIRDLCRLTVGLRGVEPHAYGDHLSQWQSAFDSLAPFTGELPAVTVARSHKQAAGTRGRGGRKQNNEALARDLLDGWQAYEPEDGRKTKDRYLAQRPDVRTLKTPDARERKIASLRTALESAQHLSREKTKQKRRARG